MKCSLCEQEKLAFQCAHRTCKDCGEVKVHCFVCDYQAYAAVDAFRKTHEEAHHGS